LSKAGAGGYLHQLMQACPAAVNAAHYARIVAEMAARRALTEMARRLLQQARDPVTDLGTMCAAARTHLDGLEAPVRGRRLILTPASQIEPEPVIWAWEDDGAGRIPAGSFGLF